MNIEYNLWIVGLVKETNHLEWSFIGAYSAKEKAVTACTSRLHFVGPAVLNETLPDEITEWEDSFYPIN